MIPVIVFGLSDTDSEMILNALDMKHCDYRLLVRTCDMAVARRFIGDEMGVTLVVTTCVHETGAESFGCLAYEQNRENYIVAVTGRVNEISDMVNRGINISGILPLPFSRENVDALMERLCGAYEDICRHDDDVYISLHAGGSVYRVRRDDIQYVEAMQKKLDIWTQSRCYSVYENMANMEGKLGNGFMRCHRSYLVNMTAVTEVDYSGMEFILNDGRHVPFSRGCKPAVHKFMNELKKA